MMKPFAVLVACCLLAASGCGTPNTTEREVTVEAGSTSPAASSPTLDATPVPTSAQPTQAAPVATPWTPPTALVGTPIPGAEATLTAGPALKRTNLTITNSQGEPVVMT